ncbi:hypothetical protein F5Y05DRAFT_416174 [Hypoxylon sp. FL0543]|nr:hypothetical protein F5Y05DRAFT_416174 [Hypoxylon sp. FL0543]
MATSDHALVNPNPNDLFEFLSDNPDVRFIRLQWLDYTNLLRCRVVPRKCVGQLVKECYTVEAGSLTSLEEAEAGPQRIPTEAVGQAHLIADWASLRLCPWAPGHASVQCYFGKEEEGNHLVDEICPRFALLKADNQVLGVLIGFKIEFRVSERDKSGQACSLVETHSASSIDTLEQRMLPVMDEIVKCVESAGDTIFGYHAGDQRDQYNIITYDAPPLIAADTLVFIRQVVRNVCKKHSLVPTFDQSPTDEELGSVYVPSRVHINISLNTVGLRLEESILAGILEHLNAIFAFGLPLPMSYERVVASQREFGRFEAWGTHNREVPIQKMGPASWKLRCVDASANIYLVLAAVITSAEAGMKGKTKLTVKDCQVDPETLSKEDRKHLGITRKLPHEVKAAHSFLKVDQLLNDALGSVLVEKYLRVMATFADVLNNGCMYENEQRELLCTRL